MLTHDAVDLMKLLSLKPAPSQDLSQFLRLFLTYLLPLLGLLIFGGWFTYSSEVEREMKRLQELEMLEVVLGARNVEQNLRYLTSEVSILASSPLLKNFLESGSEQDRSALNQAYRDVARNRQFYHQIRYLDESGMERVRVDSDEGLVKIIAQARLQDKSGRYYFTDAFALDKGEFYFSRFDLNIEHGQIELPYRPMLRVAQPVFDDESNKRGIAIINYAGAQILEDFAAQFVRDQLSHAMLLDGFGYWLMGPDKDAEWGFMFNNDHSFASRFADEWSTISQQPGGQFQNDKGLFSFHKIRLNGESSSQGPENQLFALSFVPTEHVTDLYSGARNKIWGSVVILALIAIGGIYYLTRSVLSGQAFRQELAIQEHQQLLLESMSEGVLGVDSEGICTFMNQSAIQTLGYAESGLVSRPLHQIIHHKHLDSSKYPQSDCPIIKALEEGRIFRGEEYFLNDQGRMVPVDVFLNPVMQNGQVSGGDITFRDISAQIEARDEIYRLSNFDRITNLANRRLIISQLNNAMEVLGKKKISAALIVLDIDRFTYINDALGTHGGNFILLSLAERFKGMVRNKDLLARIGSDEFAIYLNEVNADETLAWINRLLEISATPFEALGKDIQIALSIGVCLLPRDAGNAVDAIQHAQIAMARAKVDHLQKVQFFDPLMQTYSLRVTQLEQDLRKAISNNDFELYYQPQLGPAGELKGAEALIRWPLADGTIISPGEFIPVAEETGLIQDIDKWVMETSILQRKQWLEQLPQQRFTLAINLSAKQFSSPDLIEFMQQVLARNELDSSLLELEITERSMMGDPDMARQIMHDLKALGVNLSIDDFGTGYSSLVYLKNLPIDVLKVDQSFVRDMVESKGAESIVRAMVSMASALNMKTIAEGVERDDQLSMLERMKCDMYQGYLFSRPLSKADFEQWLKTPRALTIPHAS